MKVIGMITSPPKPLQGNSNGSKKEYEKPLHSFSIEGFSILIPGELLDEVPARGEVSVLVSTNWKSGSKRPNFWLQALEAVPV